MLKLLLGSGGIRNEKQVELYHHEMSHHFEGIDEVLFIPYAGKDHDYYLKRIQDFSAPSGIKLVGIHHAKDPIKAVEEAKGIYVGGGNTFLLTRDLHENEIIEPIRNQIKAGIPYMGVSAGSNVAGPTMQTTNDMPIVSPPSFETLNLVPFQINPHYFAGQTWVKEGEGYTPHHGETRQDRLREFHQHNTTPVLGLWEGTYLRWNGEIGELMGGNATVFQAGKEPTSHDTGTLFDGSLESK